MSVDFEVAGTGVRLRAPTLDGLVDRYRAYPGDSRAPDLLVSLEIDPDFAPTAPVTAPYPGFEHSVLDDGRIRLRRADAEGVVTVPAELDDPATAAFRVRQMRGAGDAVVRVALALALPRRSGLILHCSCIAFGTRAYVFCGPSGAGKSTIARLLTETSERTALSDELLVASKHPGRWTAFAAPFHTSGEIAHGRHLPIGGVYFLAHGADHRVDRLAPADALPHVLRNTLTYAAESRTAGQVMDAACDLVERVPCHALRFAPTKDVVEVLEIT